VSVGWRANEAAQVEYERLRATLLAGEALDQSLAWRRLQRHGLAGLIDWQDAQASFAGSLEGARRVSWSGAVDPREGRLAEVYGFLLAAGASEPVVRAVGS